MSQKYWQKQGSEPLFPNLLWSRPETRRGAGKLLIIGGQAQEFANVAECYAAAERAGAGTIRVIMPDSTRKVTGHMPNIEYAPSNQSGSFSAAALAELLSAAEWADGVLIAGDLGKNSETSLMLEKFFNKHQGLLCVATEALASFSTSYKDLIIRVNTILIFTLPDLQKAAIELSLTEPITSTTSHSRLAAILHDLSSDHPATIVYSIDGTLWVSSDSRVSSTNGIISGNTISAASIVWALQNPGSRFEAVTTALIT